MDWLRAKGIAKATSQTDRVSKEGLIAVNTSPSGSVTLVEINSETGATLPFQHNFIVI
jgi:translation elongation factor EF-Ts